MKHTLSVLVENKPGVLTRVAGLFARRGFNIQSLAVGASEDPNLSRMTITIDGAEHPIDQVTKQLHKLINVVKIRDLDPHSLVASELMLVKVAAEGEKRTDVLQIAEIFKAKIKKDLSKTMEKTAALVLETMMTEIQENVRRGRFHKDLRAKLEKLIESAGAD